MSTWTVQDNGDELLATIESLPDGKVRLDVTPEPVTWNSAEQIRSALGAAIGDARATAQGTP